MSHRRAPFAVALLALCGLSTASADALQMPAASTQQTSAQQQGEERPLLTMELPVKGMSMAQVEARFGAPVEKIPPVGEPPISRWIYDDYTVYFEHKYVIHAVLNRK